MYKTHHLVSRFSASVSYIYIHNVMIHESECARHFGNDIYIRQTGKIRFSEQVDFDKLEVISVIAFRCAAVRVSPVNLGIHKLV